MWRSAPQRTDSPLNSATCSRTSLLPPPPTFFHSQSFIHWYYYYTLTDLFIYTTNPSIHFWSRRFIIHTYFRQLPILHSFPISSSLVLEMLLEPYLLRSLGIQHLFSFLFEIMHTSWLHMAHMDQTLLLSPAKRFSLKHVLLF